MVVLLVGLGNRFGCARMEEVLYGHFAFVAGFAILNAKNENYGQRQNALWGKCKNRCPVKNIGIDT
jgi:hypothetical protein